MSVKIIAQLNLFSQERQEWECESQSIGRILEKIDSTKTVDSGWRVMVNDLPVTDFSTVASDGDTVYIKLVPEGDTQSQGVGMKVGGWAMVILGTVLAIATSWTGIGAMAGMALIGAGIGMATSGHILYNLDIPSLNNKEREQPEQDPSIRGSENQSRPLGTIPTLLGRRRIYPDLAATSYTWVDKNGHQYLYQLFCLGQAEQEVDTATLKIDETLLADYSATGDISQVLAGTDGLIDVTIRQGGDRPPMMTKCVHEEQLNAILKNKTEEGQDASIVRTTPDKTEEIHLDIFFYNGLGKYNDNGDVVDASVRLETLYKRSDQGDGSYQSLGTFSYGSNTITGKELKTKRYTIHKTGLPPASYTVKVSRITPDSEDNKVVDAVYVGSIRSLKGEAPVSPERCRLLTLMAVRIRVSEKLNSVIKKLNVESQARLPSWSGTGTGLMGWPHSKSSNPASAMVYAMTGGFSQQKLKDSEIDWTSLQRLYQWCQDKGYECNEYVSESMPISSLLTRIASTCRSEVVRMNGRITVIQDIERPAPVQLFTPCNSHGYTESIIMADLPDAMSLQYTDEEAGFAKNELTIYNTASGNKEAEPETTQDVPLWGVTSSVQARKLGMYKYAVSKNRPVVAKFSCDFEYLLCNKGDRIRYAGDIALTGISQGRIAGLVRNTVGQIIAVTTDEALPMEAGKTYGMRIRGQDGSIVLHQLVTEIGEFKEAVFAASVGEGEVAEGDLFSFGLLDNDSKEFIITEISCGENLSADITCTEYAPEIFAVDDPAFILPDYDPKITNVPAVMDGGNITLSNWQTWTTYHDQFDLPPKPTGDGSTGGWHRLATAQSMWVSSKTARTLSDGEWSEPYPSSGLALDKLMNGTGIGAPDAPVIESVTAEQNGINITITPPVGNINNLSVRYTVELTKNSGTTTIESTSLSAVYSFDRKVDGYPEASDLYSWRVRVKAVNVYGKESPWSDEAAVDTSSYGTWTLQSPLVDVGVMDRTVTLQFGQPPRGDMRQLYGTTQYCLQVQRPDLDDKWYKPNTSDNPYADETNFRSEEGGLLVVQNSFYAQTMPLSGQDTSQITDTLYRFRIFCRNEAYISRGEDGPAVEVNATALCTNIRDIVKAKETAKEAYISNLSAISANIGRISQGGLGDDLNFWNLSTFTDDLGNTHHKGTFRVGSHNNYIEVAPILEDGRVVDYKVVIQASSINVDANLSQFTTTIYLYDHDDDTIRMMLSSTGMKLQRRADGDIWQDLSVMQIDRLHNLIVSTRPVGSVNSVQLPADTLSQCVPLDYSKRMFTIGNQGFAESILTEDVYPLLDGGYTGGPTPVRQSSFCGKAVVGVLAPVAFFSDASDIEFGRNRRRIIEPGKGDLANLFNANASTAWGLTQTQVDAGLAVAREDT